MTALEIAQAQSHEESCRVLHDHLKSQQSLQTAQSDVSAGDTDRPTESQQSLQTEDKPPESQQSSQTTEVNTGDTDKPPESHRQQVLLYFLLVRPSFGLDKATSSQTGSFTWGTCTNVHKQTCA